MNRETWTRVMRLYKLYELRCGNPDCSAPVAHIEGRWNHVAHLRFWCEEHVPMSGHYEWCDPRHCGELMTLYAVHRDQLMERGDELPLFFCLSCRTAVGPTEKSRGCRCGCAVNVVRGLP